MLKYYSENFKVFRFEVGPFDTAHYWWRECLYYSLSNCFVFGFGVQCCSVGVNLTEAFNFYLEFAKDQMEFNYFPARIVGALKDLFE